MSTPPDAELESKGVAFDGETIETGVCSMAFFKDPDGNSLMLHRRYAPHDPAPSSASATAALPLPTTKDEHWRFTDLSGFDPDAWAANGAAGIAAPPSMLELDASGVAQVGEGGIEIDERTRRDPLRAAHRRS